MLSDDAKAIVASNLVIAQEIRRLVLLTDKRPISPDYANESLDIFKRLLADFDRPEGSR